MITRTRLLKRTGIAVAGSFGVGSAVGASRSRARSLPIALPQQYVRSRAPGVLVRHPADWIAQEDWGASAYVNPLPLVALTNVQGGLTTESDDLLPNPHSLRAEDAVLVFCGVPIVPGETYMPAAPAAAGVSAAGRSIRPTGVDGISGVFDWLLHPNGSWGYLIYGYLGDGVPNGHGTMQGVLASARFG